MKHKISRKLGVTVIEFLVALAMALTLTALSLPAIQKSRVAARESGCRNNLKQIGLAFQNYHDVYNTWPPGYVGDTNVNTAGYGLWSWAANLMPYMDQAPLYCQLLPGSRTPSQNLDLGPDRLVSITALKCPADMAADLNEAEDRLVKSLRYPQGRAVRAANYVAVNNTWGLLNNRVPRNGLDGSNGAHGVFFKNSHVGVHDIVDGTSSTLMIGERVSQLTDRSYILKAAVTYIITADGKTAGNATQHVAGSSDGSDNGLVFGFGAAITKLNDVSAAAQARNACRQSFSSQHPGGVHFLMCDGSVRFISDSIDHKTSSPDAKSDALIDSLLEYLISIDDGKTVSEF